MNEERKLLVEALADTLEIVGDCDSILRNAATMLDLAASGELTADMAARGRDDCRKVIADLERGAPVFADLCGAIKAELEKVKD